MHTRKYLEWVERKVSTWHLAVTLVFAGSLVLVALPALIIGCAGWLDRAFSLPRFGGGLVNPVVGAVCLAGGGFLALWAVYAEATIGSGTPVPLIPTQRLVVKPPFRFCRNPMVLGTVVAYLGIGLWLGSFSAIGMVLVIAALLLLYVKVFEEKELEARFGQDYVDYKRRTPFLVPRLTRRPPND